MTKLSLYNVQQNQSIELDDGTTVQIGRGFFAVTDKRVSRKHGEISVQNKSIKIKACHVNPIYYKKNGSDQIYVLHKDSDVTLANLDKFSLLPNDELAYEVRVVDDAPEGDDTSHVASTTNDDITPDITDINDHLKIAVNIGSSSSTQTNSVNATAPSTNNLPSTSTEQSNRKRLLEENNHDEEQNKKLKDMSSNESGNSVDATLITTIKPDPDAQPSTIPTAASIPVDTSKVKTDPDAVPSSSNVKTEPDSTVKAKSSEPPHLRSSCDFGVGCYRTTGEHRCKLAHPSDLDYRRPYFPPAPTEAPFCPYGSSCYRRNPDHFREMQHPPASKFLFFLKQNQMKFINLNLQAVYIPQPLGARPVVPVSVNPPQPAVNNDDEDDAGFLDFSQQDEDLDDSDVRKHF